MILRIIMFFASTRFFITLWRLFKQWFTSSLKSLTLLVNSENYSGRNPKQCRFNSMKRTQKGLIFNLLINSCWFILNCCKKYPYIGWFNNPCCIADRNPQRDRTARIKLHTFQVSNWSATSHRDCYRPFFSMNSINNFVERWCLPSDVCICLLVYKPKYFKVTIDIW